MAPLHVFLIAILVAATSACLHHDLSVQDVDQNLKRRSSYVRAAGKTGIRNIKIFTGTRFRRGVLAIDGDQITYNLENVETWIDGDGGFLIPGLIDSHCHPASIGDLERLSSYGVTTALNMNCANYTLCASLKDQPGLTSFFTANHGITAPNTSHAIVFQTPPDLLMHDPSQAEMFVDYAFSNESDWLKISAEVNGPSQESHNRLVDLTHKLGRQTMTHATTILAYLQAIVSKTDGIQHTPGDGLLTPEVVEDLKRNNKWVTPTTIVVRAFINNPVALDLSSYTNRSWPIVVQNVQTLREAGVRLLVGTDAIPLGGPPIITVPHSLGNTLHDELEVFVNEVGFRPSEALRAATFLPALMHRLTDRGFIGEGKRADLVLLRSNPLRNISATRDIARVWNAGIEYTAIAEN